MLFQLNGASSSIDLLKEAPAGSGWAPTFAFQPDGQTMLGLLVPKATAGGTIMSIQLSTGALSPELTFHGYTDLDGVSAGCPIVNSAVSSNDGAWRACGSCNGPAFAAGTSGGSSPSTVASTSANSPAKRICGRSCRPRRCSDSTRPVRRQRPGASPSVPSPSPARQTPSSPTPARTPPAPSRLDSPPAFTTWPRTGSSTSCRPSSPLPAPT